jgi:hypothetical protein
MFHRHRSRNQHVVALSMPPFVRVGCLLILLVIFPFWFFAGRTTTSDTDFGPLGLQKRNGGFSGIASRLGKNNKHRLAIVIPFVGEGPEAVPPYLELFCTAAAGSASLVDFLLIHSGVLDGYHGNSCPDNVIFISLSSIENFSKYLVRVVDHKPDEDIAVEGSRETLAKILSKHIIKYPYVLVEFKPALGHIFAEFLEGYTHWGYSDLDILFGDLERWISPDELNDFDIVTYGYGDQDRAYMRGQFTFHKNDKDINQIWRLCDYLADMDKRFLDVITGEAHLHFESAEGCYSAAVLQRNDIKVKYAVKAFTDINEKDTAHSHGLFVGTGKKKSTTVLYKAGSKEDGKALERIPDTWFENKDSLYRDTKKPLQFEVGERERLPTVEKADAKCMFWAQKKYQSRLCLDDVHSSDTVYWIDGHLYKQKYEMAPLPGKVVSAPFFHFQEYKRYFRLTQLAGFHRSGPVRTFVLSKEGVLPIYPDEFKVDRSFVPSPLDLRLRKWKAVKGNDRTQLPNRGYCLRSGPRKFPANPPAPQCQFASSWKDEDTIQILSGAPSWAQVDVETEVTMVLTLQLQPSQVANEATLGNFLQLIGMYLDRWQGQPSVIVLHAPKATPEAQAMLRIKLGPGSDLSLFGLDTCLVGVIFSDSSEFLSRKAILNMATDVVPTRWFISGFELERGLVISHDTAFFAHRVSVIHRELNGSVFVIPQFGLEEKESDFTLPALLKAKKDGEFQALSKLDESGCETTEDNTPNDDGSSLFDAMHDHWWKLSEGYITGTTMDNIDDRVHNMRAAALDDIQMDIVGLLTEQKQYSLFAMDISPILMIDNMGPRDGMKSSEIAREVEEFGGKRCYNGLRLAQLATFGYSVNVLAGAFALSTPSTRAIALADPSDEATPTGASRCDGCFLFDEDHEEILEDISKDERKRPAKAALLWEHPTNSDPLFGHT